MKYIFEIVNDDNTQHGTYLNADTIDINYSHTSKYMHSIDINFIHIQIYAFNRYQLFTHTSKYMHSIDINYLHTSTRLQI